MFTQCSKCETVFKLSAEVLRAAGGQVRCGNCGEVFNALASLAEDSSAFAAGESALQLEVRADSILETVLPPRVAQEMAREHEEFNAPGVEIARLEVLDWTEEDQARHEHAGAQGGARGGDAESDRAMEFTLPPGELDRIFVESKKPALAPPPEELAPAAGPDAAGPDAAGAPPSESEPPPHPESAAAHSPFVGGRVSGLEVPEEVRRDMLAQFEQHIRPASRARNAASRGPRRRALIVWAGAAAVSALLLSAQIAHQNREWFAAHAHGPLGAVVRAVYGALGTPLPAPANLSAYELRQWGVTGDPAANGTLRVRASILNTAAQFQPYPLLRVTLADRFGKNIGRRDFEPGEYMGKPTAKLLAPGERVDATLTILDPGKNAEGFEIDVCLRGVDQRVTCANDAAPQAKR